MKLWHLVGTDAKIPLYPRMLRYLRPFYSSPSLLLFYSTDQLLADAGYWSEDNARLENERTEMFIATTKDWKQRKAQREHGAPLGPTPKDATLKERMERKLLTERGKAAYKQRGATIEPVFGQMVMRNLVRFWLRGIGKVKGEWSLWCTTHNILKLWRAGVDLSPG